MRELYNKHKLAIVYTLFSVLTIIVNWLIYFPLFYGAKLSATASNAVAWFAAVIFAFFTSKIFVFKCNDWSAKHMATEAARFFTIRSLSGLLETGFLLVVVDIYTGNGVVWKLVAGSVVFVLNYFGSRFLVFRNNKNIPSD